MSANRPPLVSGRVPVTDYGNLTADRYEFLGLNQAEPNLGPGAANAVLTLGNSNTRIWTNSLTLQQVSVTGNITGGNILTVGNVSANNASVTGNIIVGNSIQLANNNGGTTQVFRIQYNAANAAVDFIFV